MNTLMGASLFLSIKILFFGVGLELFLLQKSKYFPCKFEYHTRNLSDFGKIDLSRLKFQKIFLENEKTSTK